jgi:hypothetical protein
VGRRGKIWPEGRLVKLLWFLFSVAGGRFRRHLERRERRQVDGSSSSRYFYIQGISHKRVK